MFVDAANGDFYLQFHSPAINVGVDLNNSDLNSSLVVDYGQNSRVTNAQRDIGAYEYHGISTGSVTPVNKIIINK